MVAWAQGCLPDRICTSIRVTALTTGHTHDYPAPRGTTGWVAPGGQGSRDAFSSDGKYLAVRAAKGASQFSPSDVYIIRISTGSKSLMPDSGSLSPYSRVAWLPNSYWVVAPSATGSTQAFNVQGGQHRSFSTPCCGVALLTVSGVSHQAR